MHWQLPVFPAVQGNYPVYAPHLAAQNMPTPGRYRFG